MILLEGMGRSGTSLLARLMATMLEPQGYAYFYEPFHHPTPAGRFEGWEKMIASTLRPDDSDPALRQYIEAMERVAGGKLFWKEIRLALKQDWLLKQFPGLKIVHITRDILGVISSHRRPGAPDWMNRHRELWCAALAEWAGAEEVLHDKGITPPSALKRLKSLTQVQQYSLIWSMNEDFVREIQHNRLMVVRYEDLCASPRETLGSISHFSGIEADEPLMIRLLAQLSESDRELDPSGPGAGLPAGEMPSIWRARLSAQEISSISEVAGQSRGRLGYPRPDPEGGPEE